MRKPENPPPHVHPLKLKSHVKHASFSPFCHTAIDSERYLHDPSSGSIITPNVSSTTPPDGAGAGDAEIDSLIFPAGYTPIRAFNRVHGNQSNTDKARAVLKAVERMKVKIGPGLDQGGCELATPARNAAVGNDEGVFRLVQQTS